jgi:hypothetical protein
MEGFDVDVVIIGAGKPNCSLQGLPGLLTDHHQG